MRISEGQLRMLSIYYDTYDPFVEKKEVKVDDSGIQVVSMVSVYHPDENQYMPEEVWQSLELWYMKHEIEVKQWLGADDLPF